MDTLSARESNAASALDAAFEEKARALRPFYFIVVVWGERYTDFLLNFCIPSLLSPDNIPALRNRGNKFLIATTHSDWESMQNRPIFLLLKKYVEPVFIPIPPCPEGVSQCVHMGIGHKLATHLAFEDRAYAAVLTPDMMLSDGTIAGAQRHAVNGIQVVLVAALRFGEEPLFEHLDKLGLVSIDSRLGDEGRPLVATGRQFVWAGLRGMHSETLRYEWEKPCFHNFPSAAWWRVDSDGILVHSLSWAPLLVDYGAVEHHDSSVMDNWTIDGDYVYRNFGLDGKVHVVRDSDEVMLISWAPLSDREQSLEPTSPNYTKWLIGEWFKGATFHEALSNPVFDPLKLMIFPKPVYWHAGEIDPSKWRKVERKAADVIAKYGFWTGTRSAEQLAHIHTDGMGRLARIHANGVDKLARLHASGVALRGGTLKAVARLRQYRLILLSTILRWTALAAAHERQFSKRIKRFVTLVVPDYVGRVTAFLRYYWRNRGHLLSLAGQALRGNFAAWERIKRSFGFFMKLVKGSSNVYD